MITTIAIATLALQKHKLHSAIDTPDSKIAIKVTVDGDLVTFEGTQPMMIASHVLVPMRGVFEKVGADLKWDPAMETVTAHRDGHEVIVTLGRKQADVDGGMQTL